MKIEFSSLLQYHCAMGAEFIWVEKYIRLFVFCFLFRVRGFDLGKEILKVDWEADFFFDLNCFDCCFLQNYVDNAELYIIGLFFFFPSCYSFFD